MFKQIAEKHLISQERPAISRADLARATQRILRLRMTIALGVMSVVIYGLLYIFSSDLVHLAQLTHQGDHTFFFVPVVIALLFSFVHGAFTSHFWDAMGVKPRQIAS